MLKISSTDPRIDILRKKTLQIITSNTCKPPVPNGLPSTQPPQTRPISKEVSELLSLGDVLRRQAELLSGNAQLEKLNEAQEALEAALASNQKNARVLCSLGDVLRLQAELLSGTARLTKLKEAQDKLTASLQIDLNNAFVLCVLEKVRKLQPAIAPAKDAIM